ncbi:hypothetical protein EGW08_011389 [Elysia chlorotica]|uniref:FAD dependent oxidoreductase domain-containing protein n=1 Tax=Elysia chlorotica TaxID=188477 RepID=A0A3S0ZR67_ELYCH|nr:hypothetical protein EGW08_011389 [Elysia chlorotica]
MVLRIGVIGAGVVGLSSALAVQKRLAHAQVDIMADRFTTYTTSNGAGGLFMPRLQDPDVLDMAKDSADFFYSLARSADSGPSGVSFINGFYLYNGDDEQFPVWTKLMISVRELPEEFRTMYEKHYKHGCMMTTAIIEGSKYLPWLTDRFIANGGRITEKTVESFDELAGDYDLVLNCAGLGAGKLANDPTVHPVRGQVMHVSAPWLTYFVNSDDTHYFFPHSEDAVIGGVRQPGSYDLAPDPQESRRMLREMEERLPPLKGAKILSDWVGLRPSRDRVRVEAETVNCRGKQLKVVHNYGHGAFGISLSWGTAVRTANLVHQALTARSKL